MKPGTVAVILTWCFPALLTAQWPGWRGPSGTGVAAATCDPPIVWDEGQNIQWKVKLDGLGHSTPVVWGDRLFVTSARPVGEKMPPRFSGAPGAHDNLPVRQRHQFWVTALSVTTGKVVWQRLVREALPHEGGHHTGSLASASPTCDATHLIAFFGSQGIFCLNHDGDVLWEHDFGRMSTKHGHGEGSSPYLYGDSVVVNWDHEGQSFLCVMDKSTGAIRWQRPRDEVTSWSSPIVVEVDGRAQAIVAGTGRVRGYDLANGEVLWECGGLSANVVATPVAAHGMVYVGSSYDTRKLMAIRLAAASGDITDSRHVVWSRRDRTPYVPSPLLYGDHLYFLRHYQGILTRVEAPSGTEPTGPFRLGGIRNVYASPVGAADRIYITDLDGVTQVISRDAVPRTLAVNRLDESFAASAAIVGNAIYLRGRQHIYCIAEPDRT